MYTNPPHSYNEADLISSDTGGKKDLFDNEILQVNI